jgi:hypothetical protein
MNYTYVQSGFWLGLEKNWSRKRQYEVLFDWLRSYLPQLLRKVADETPAAIRVFSPLEEQKDMVTSAPRGATRGAEKELSGQ